MKLEDQFENNIIGIKGEIEIAENFAIGFVQWCLKEENNIYFETKQLLEIYEKTL